MPTSRRSPGVGCLHSSGRGAAADRCTEWPRSCVKAVERCIFRRCIMRSRCTLPSTSPIRPTKEIKHAVRNRISAIALPLSGDLGAAAPPVGLYASPSVNANVVIEVAHRTAQDAPQGYRVTYSPPLVFKKDSYDLLRYCRRIRSQRQERPHSPCRNDQLSSHWVSPCRISGA